MRTTHTLLSGEQIEYEAAPELADFFARAAVAAHDPTVSVGQMVELLYGEENPLLVKGVFPGRGFVTPEVLTNPAYRVMLDLLDQKRVQAGALNLEAARANHHAHSMSVPDAAAQLGISPSAVRQAIAGGRLRAVRRSGQHWLRPDDVAAYKVSRRGPPRSTVPELEVRIGSEDGCGLHLDVVDGDLEARREAPGSSVQAGRVREWQRLLVKTVYKPANSVRYFELEPDTGDVQELQVGGLYVRGRFKVARKINNRTAALEAWKARRGQGGQQAR